MFNFPQVNDMVPVGQLMELNNALRKATQVGYQTPANVSGAGSISALVPQSIEGSLASATFTMKELALWPRMPKVSVSQTVHEYNRIEEHGQDLDPFIAEGAGGVTGTAEYSRQFVKIKYLAERREVTDVASFVGILGANSTAIAEETERGTLRLMSKLEKSIWFADENLNDLQFTGILPQMRANAPADLVQDLAGSSVTPELLQAKLGEVYGAPHFGRPDTIYVEPRVHADLIQQSVAYGRHDQLQVTDGGKGLTFGHKQLSIMAPYGAVPIVAAPFLWRATAAPTASAGSNPPAGITIDAQPSAAGAVGSFTAAEAGDYIYKIVAYGDGGYAAPLTTNAVTVAAGNTVTIDIADAGLTGHGNGKVNYYKVYRSAKNGAASTCTFLFELKFNVDDAGTNTRILDAGVAKEKTSSIFAVEHNPQILQYCRLLDFLRRPLAEVATTKPFLLLMMGSPVLKIPEKCFLLDNVGTS